MEAARSERSFQNFAVLRGLKLSTDAFARYISGKSKTYGSEHEVYFDEDVQRVVKVTHLGSYGQSKSVTFLGYHTKRFFIEIDI